MHEKNTNTSSSNFTQPITEAELLISELANYEKEQEMEELGIQGHTTVLFDMSKYEIRKLYNNYIHKTQKLNTLIIQIIPQQLKLVEQCITYMLNNLSSEVSQVNYTMENLL